MPTVEKDHGKIGVCFIETMCLLVVVEIIDPAFSGSVVDPGGLTPIMLTST